MSTEDKVRETQGIPTSFLEGTFLSNGPQTPCSRCYCKKCCYHCYRCFLQKGLGITYVRERKRRHARTTAEDFAAHSSTTRSRSPLPSTTRPQQGQKKE
ncbi:tat protein [Simian immunodeficiency virus]|uniref:Protein Tat n=1 Tax=Simian immunodeficiency virus TaxID=11723 RepID=Q699U8_SIV|nr:tat protein [Simian immunodeficiency virus]